MKRLSLNTLVRGIVVIIFITCITVSKSVPVSTAENIFNEETGTISEDARLVAHANNVFALELYAEISQGAGNVFFSPFSISSSFAMVYAGSHSNTETQIADVLHYDLEQERLHPAFNELTGALNEVADEGKYELVVANAMWAQYNYIFLQKYLNLLDAYYGAEIFPVNFAGAPADAAEQINEWAKNITQDNITEIITEQDFDPSSTVFIMTSAVYFKGTWVYQFDKNETQDAPFYLTDGSEIQVPMMMSEGDFRIMQGETFQVLEMPYVGGKLTMLVLLPHEVEGLAELEASLSVSNLDRWISQLTERNMTVVFPKFSVVTPRIELKTTLSKMGMPDAFIPRIADFSGMDGTQRIFLDDVYQKAFIGVDEEGTEAGAVNVVIGACAVENSFSADHPFLFLIRDTRSGVILFLGKVENPMA